MALIARISVQNLILGNQTFGALCQKYFVAKFQRRPYLAALNEIGMRLKYGVELLRIRNLFSLEHATARLINHTVAQIAIVLDFRPIRLNRQSCSYGFGAHILGPLEHPSGVAHGLCGDAPPASGCGTRRRAGRLHQKGGPPSGSRRGQRPRAKYCRWDDEYRSAPPWYQSGASCHLPISFQQPP